MLNHEGERQGGYISPALTQSSQAKEEMQYLMPLVMMLSLAGCDSTKTPPVDEGEVSKSVGTFRALLNGKPWEAKAEYFVTRQGYVHLYAVSVDSSKFPYQERMVISNRAECFCKDVVIQTSNDSSSSEYDVFFSESQGDGLIQTWTPVPGSPGALRVTEADSTTRRFRATFEGTFVGMSSKRVPIQTLPDTLRITNGVFEITLNTSKR